MDITSDYFKNVVLAEVPRILGLGDRLTGSKTFGCFDRYYWHYKQVDFSNARFQEAALLLAMLYKENFEGNVYYNNKAVYGWSLGAVEFWSRIQHGNGSFDEIYPNEYSFVATAFTTYAVTECLLIMGREEGLSLKKDIEKAGDWLLKHSNPYVANQVAGSIAALYNIYLLYGTEKYKLGCEEKISEILKMQQGEGYLLEYGGYDIGYLTIALAYLAAYNRKARDARLDAPLLKALNFLRLHIREDGTFNYEGTSRRTQYIYPSGILMLGGHDIARKCVTGLSQNKIVNPSWMDDRFCIPMAIDYLKTYLSSKRRV